MSSDCTYGLTILGSGFGVERFERAQELARRAEEAGFATVWVSELYNRSATILMASLAAATERCGIGSSIAYGVGRTPVVWAAEARDLDELSGGRLILGLGNGNTGMMENWHGVSGEAPAVRMEELIVLLGKLWRLDKGPVHHEGRFYRVHLDPTSDTAPPLRPHLPIYAAGINPRMIQGMGRVADGLIGHPMFTKLYVDEVVRPAIEAGAAKAQRDPQTFELVGILICALDENVEAARRRVAYSIAQYAASRVYDRLFEIHGWSGYQQEIREAARRRDADAMIAAVPDAAIDAIAVACRPHELPESVARHAADYDHLDLTGPPWGVTPIAQEQAAVEIVEAMREALSVVA
jgi:probable F420-dependent oxidoreductase